MSTDEKKEEVTDAAASGAALTKTTGGGPGGGGGNLMRKEMVVEEGQKPGDKFKIPTPWGKDVEIEIPADKAPGDKYIVEVALPPGIVPHQLFDAAGRARSEGSRARLTGLGGRIVTKVIEVPEGLTVGDKFPLTTPWGLVIEVEVPEGAGPGDKFTFRTHAPETYLGDNGNGGNGNSQPRMVEVEVNVPLGVEEGKEGESFVATLPWGQDVNVMVPEGGKVGDKFKIEVPLPSGAPPPPRRVYSPELTVPEDHPAGEPMRVTVPWGGTVSVDVPECAGPGDTFKVDVPVPAEIAEPQVFNSEITIPDDAQPGSVLKVTLPWGVVLDVTVPEGATPGNIIKLQVPMPPGAQQAIEREDKERREVEAETAFQALMAEEEGGGGGAQRACSKSQKKKAKQKAKKAAQKAVAEQAAADQAKAAQAKAVASEAKSAALRKTEADAARAAARTGAAERAAAEAQWKAATAQAAVEAGEARAADAAEAEAAAAIEAAEAAEAAAAVEAVEQREVAAAMLAAASVQGGGAVGGLQQQQRRPPLDEDELIDGLAELQARGLECSLEYAQLCAGLQLVQASARSGGADKTKGPERDAAALLSPLGTMLQQHSLQQHAAVLEENGFSLADVGELTSDDLKEMGVVKLKDRKVLLKVFEAHAEGCGAAAATPAPAAPGASASATIEATLSCNICMEMFELPPGARTPKTLLCAHSFCERCLLAHARGAASIECPTCRETTQLPREGVAGLKNTYVLLPMLASFLE